MSARGTSGRGAGTGAFKQRIGSACDESVLISMGEKGCSKATQEPGRRERRRRVGQCTTHSFDEIFSFTHLVENRCARGVDMRIKRHISSRVSMYASSLVTALSFACVVSDRIASGSVNYAWPFTWAQSPYA